jgi:hypothetical protein
VSPPRRPGRQERETKGLYRIFPPASSLTSRRKWAAEGCHASFCVQTRWGEPSLPPPRSPWLIGEIVPNWCADENLRRTRELALSCLTLLAENGNPVGTPQWDACARNYRAKCMEKTVMRRTTKGREKV